MLGAPRFAFDVRVLQGDPEELLEHLPAISTIPRSPEIYPGIRVAGPLDESRHSEEGQRIPGMFGSSNCQLSS